MLHETSRGGPSARQQALSRFADRMRVNRRTYDDYPGYIVSLLRIKKACAIANAEAGALDPERARAIASACDGLADGGRFPVDTFVDAYPLLDEMLNTAIAERASRISGVPDVCPDRHVGLSQGGRDVIATADTLFIHDALEQVFAVLPGLEHALMAKGDAFRNVLVMGRETLRDTLPVSLSHVFEGYGKQVRRARLRLEEELPRWNTCALGASVAGTGFGCAPGFRELACKHLSAACGRTLIPCGDGLLAVQNAESIVLAHACLEALALVVGRIAGDLILMASGPKCGLGDVRIPAAQPGSSIMPGKVNPVVPDMLSQIGLKVGANHACIAHAACGGGLECGCDASMIRRAFHESAEMLARGIPLFVSKVIEGTQPGESLRDSWRPGYLLLRRLLGDEAARRVFERAAGQGIPYAGALQRENLPRDVAEALSDPARLADAEGLAPLFARTEDGLPE